LAFSISYDLFVFEVKFRHFPADDQKAHFAEQKNQNNEKNIGPASHISPESK